MVPESEAVYGFLSARAFAVTSARLQGLPDPDAAAARAIAWVGLEADQDRPMKGYSKGMRQRAKIAAALVHDPQVLILDEPFNGTDPRQRLQLMALLREMAAEGRTIIFSSHILEEVERLADEVLVILAGQLAASGDFQVIRRLMTDRPHSFSLLTTDDRRVASLLIGRQEVRAVTVAEEGLEVHTTDYAAFTACVAPGDSRRGRYAAAVAPPRMNRWRASSPTWCADDPHAPDAHGAAALGTKAQLVHRVACADSHPGSGRLPPGRRSNGIRCRSSSPRECSTRW